MEFEYEKRLKEIISRCGYEVDVSHISMDSNLVKDFGFTSIELIELVVEIESEFGINFDDNDLILEKLAVYGILVEKIKDSIGVDR